MFDKTKIIKHKNLALFKNVNVNYLNFYYSFVIICIELVFQRSAYMERISKNCFDMLKISKERFQDKWVRGLLATLVFMAPLAFTLIIPVIIGLIVGNVEVYSIIQSVFAVIGMFVFGPLCVGYAKYYRELQAGNKPSIKVVFDAENFKSKSLFLHIAVGLILSFTYLMIP